MKLQIVARNLTLTNTLRDHVHRRFLEMLPRYFDRESCELHIELSGGPKHRYEACQARLTVPGGLLVVSERADDAYAAVDAAEHTLARKVKEWRERVLIGSRFPKKYFIARRMEEGAAPATLPEGEEPIGQMETEATGR
jgi:ribosomal subunit interface protein